MADWFVKLMQNSHASPNTHPPARDARYDAIVQTLREREALDRDARDKRQRWYQQHVKSDAGVASDESGEQPPALLHRLRTKVPCRATPEARALLDLLARKFAGATVMIAPPTARRRPLMLAGGPCVQPTQIGWLEECVQRDDPGLALGTDGGHMLVLRFHHPPTPVRVSSLNHAEEHPAVDLAEIRPALDLRPVEKISAPRTVSLTRPELEAMNLLGSRDYEAFYLRFKVELLAGIWSSLCCVLASGSRSRWHRGSCYTVVRNPEPTKFRIHESAADAAGRVADIGSNRIYDAAPATDILLLYLEGDILADVADIYFTLQSLDSADAYFLKEEFFAVIRRFWAGSPGLASPYGGDLPAVVRMSQRALPMPAQALLLKQDWIGLRQALFDRYGERGDKAPGLSGRCVYPSRVGPALWPFSTYPAGEVNVGLRLRYRQQWQFVAAERGGRIDGAVIEPSPNTRTLRDVVEEAVDATVRELKWPIDPDGCVNTGMRALAARTEMGLEAESRERSRDSCVRVSDAMLKTATRIRDESNVVLGMRSQARPQDQSAHDSEQQGDDSAEYVYRRLQNRYDVLTRLVEIETVVLVAERLPAPWEIDRAWVRRHRAILEKALLDDSLAGALESIDSDEAGVEEPVRLYEHLRANILHYQRAVWQGEDPQQRCLRLRKMGTKMPLEWRFELDSGGSLTIGEFGKRLSAANIDAHFASYAGGREADLDQLIDPAGPIAYYGNYAVYRMRPEFGGGDAFSMLHFFKSPYVCGSEPGELRIGASMGSEIVRSFVLTTDDVAIDIIPKAPPPLPATEPSEDAPNPAAPATGGALILDHSHAMEVASARTDDAEGIVVPDAESRKPLLVAGLGTIEPRVSPIRSDDTRERTTIRINSDVPDAYDGGIVGRWSAPLCVARMPDDLAERVSIATEHGSLRLNAPIDAAHVHDRLIFVRDDRKMRLASTVHAGVPHGNERAIVANAIDWLRPSLVAG